MRKANMGRTIDYMMFDFKWQDMTYKVVLDYVMKDETSKKRYLNLKLADLYGEDPAWRAFDMPNGDVFDFQVHDFDADGVLDVDVCELLPIGANWTHGKFLTKDKYTVSNIIAIFSGGHSQAL